MPKLIDRYPNAEIWFFNGEYYIYGPYQSGDPIITDRLSFARDVAASC